MTQVQNLSRFVADASWDAIRDKTRDQIKIRLLDSLACAIGALDGEPVRKIRTVIEELDGGGRCTLIGGGTAAPDRATLYNSALIRYLDFNDNYLAKGETGHPSDNIGAILAAGEYVNASGRDLMTAIAVAYQVQCRLCDVAPVRDRGFDHATQLAYSSAAGVAKILGLDTDQIANAIALSGTALNSLRVTRTGALSHWKGLADSFTAAGALQLVLMARQGITAPMEVFEGNKGFIDAVAGRFEIDWSQEGLNQVQRTLLKKYNAETHSQTAIEAVLQLRTERAIDAAQITRVDVKIFDVAHKIIGGGEEGDKTIVRTKEEADHSLPYVLAVGLLDGRVMPGQYSPERIRQPDVQELLRKVFIHPDHAYSRRFPDAMMTRVRITLTNGQRLEREVGTLEPPSWEWAQQKFHFLAGECTSTEQRAAIIDVVANLERVRVADLMSVLGKVKGAVRQMHRRTA